MKLFRPTAAALLAMLALAAPVFAAAPLPDSPEIDPSSIAGAAALLTGGLLMLTDRLRRK
jgi:hypothetical protein